MSRQARNSSADRRPRRAGFLLLTVVLACTGLIVGCVGGNAESSEDAPPSYLYSLTSRSATVVPVQGTDEVTLTMIDADDQTVWFTDRPDRDSGVLPTSEFVDHWRPGSQFAQVPPNVSLILHHPATSTETVVAVMTAPSYDSTKHTLTTTLKVLSREQADAVLKRTCRSTTGGTKRTSTTSGSTARAGRCAASGSGSSTGRGAASQQLPTNPGAVTLFIDPEIGY